MTTTTVSPKFQIVIPKSVREAMNLSSGTKLEVIHFDNRIELIPIGKIQDLRGVLKGINTDIKREKDRI